MGAEGCMNGMVDIGWGRRDIGGWSSFERHSYKEVVMSETRWGYMVKG